jgi:subtilisin-like proprotein convertase family protein
VKTRFPKEAVAMKRKRKSQDRNRRLQMESCKRAIVVLIAFLTVAGAAGCSDDDSNQNNQQNNNQNNNNAVNEARCDDAVDNDADGQTDCDDADCVSDPACQGQVETDCGDGIDNDGDGLSDCADPECAGRDDCQVTETRCEDGVDNDGDGLTDCFDSSCGEDPACADVESYCDDELDNDGDGQTDCFDSDCVNAPSCLSESNCLDGVDNDGDGATDCTDTDCHDQSYCEPTAEQTCGDTIDNDGDGQTDCADADCADAPVCSGPEQQCQDGIDNDGDGDTDCGDADCRTGPPCEVPETSCGDEFDNDGDGAVDCSDSDCLGQVPCETLETSCGDDFDNDGDGQTDCTDSDCQWTAPCEVLEVSCGDGLDNDGDGQTDCTDSDCQWTAPCEAVEESCGDGVDNDGDGQTDCTDTDCQWIGPCEAAEVSCADAFDNDGDGQTDCADTECQGIAPCEAVEQSCNDAFDNDGDGQTDCGDSDCSGISCGLHGRVCQSGQCVCPGGEASESTCNDAADNDCDGAVDCADVDCDAQPCGTFGRICEAGFCVCPGEPSGELTCDDGLDNDCDGQADCADDQCDGQVCAPAGATCENNQCLCPGGEDPEVSCVDGTDNDCDGTADCADSDCEGVSCGPHGRVCVTGTCRCPSGATSELSCTNGQDDDCDGEVDCLDTDCDGRPCSTGGHLCLTASCQCPAGTSEVDEICVRVPQPGDLVITEFLVWPQGVATNRGQWFEIYNRAAEAVNLNGVIIENDGGQSETVGEDLLMLPDSFAVFGVEDDPALNGGVEVDYVYSQVLLAEPQDVLSLRYGAQLLDEVAYDGTYPVSMGYSATLDPERFAPDQNDTAADWCAARRMYNVTDYGTPKGPNDECLCLRAQCAAHSTCVEATGVCACDAGYYDRWGDGSCVEVLEIDGCWLDPPLNLTLTEGQTTVPLYGRVWVNGETDGGGQAVGIEAQAGYGADNSTPNDPSWVWTDLDYDGDSGNADVYAGRMLVDALVTGVEQRDYAVRFSGDGGQTWTVCDQNSGGYSPADAGQMTIIDYACPPDDPYEPNDGFGGAYTLGAAVIEDGKICNTNQDWYAVSLAAQDTLWVTMDLFHFIGDLDLRVYGPSQQIIDTSTSLFDRETVAVLSAAAGTHYIQVDGPQGCYFLDVRINPPETLCQFAVDCPAALPICEDSVCRKCRADSECDALLCHPSSGQCVECVSSADCDQGFQCSLAENVCELFGSFPFAATDVPVAIPDDDPQGVTSVVEVTEDWVVAEVYVAVFVDHGWIGDLQLVLRSPTGEEVYLHNRSGGSADNIEGTYGTDLFVDGPGALADFSGHSVLGSWTLTAVDHDFGESGSLENWTLILVP